MKKIIYLKVAQNGNKIKVQAMVKANYAPLYTGEKNYNQVYLPTVLIALDLDINDKEFSKARILLSVKIKSTEPAIEIRQVDENKRQ